MKKDKRFGFTLAEVMTVVVILGVLAAILIPVITKVLPNKSKTMFQKAYYTTEKVVKELITNEGLYPYDKNLIGFMNTTTVTYNGKTYDKPTTKFAELFASALNINGTTDWSSEYNFTTNDGIVWSLQQIDPTNGVVFKKGESILIHVDVIGGIQGPNTRKNPNCFYDATTCPNPDRFNIYVYNDGQMLVTGKKEVEYLDGIQTNPREGCETQWDVIKDNCPCPPGTQCECPPGSVRDGAKCKEKQCEPGFTLDASGNCACPSGTHLSSGHCCPTGQDWGGSGCATPAPPTPPTSDPPTCNIDCGVKIKDTATCSCVNPTCSESGTAWSDKYSKCCNTSTPSNCCSAGYIWNKNTDECEDICDQASYSDDFTKYNCRCSNQHPGYVACAYNNYYGGGSGPALIRYCAPYCQPSDPYPGSCPGNSVMCSPQSYGYTGSGFDY